MPDWSDDKAYRFTRSLSRGHWAWEFLRCQRNWCWFDETWKALEQDYGAPPNRDYPRWKNDKRAYRLADHHDVSRHRHRGSSMVPGERLLIECWMGSKWGFYKFPPGPEADMPTLLWRQVDEEVSVVHADDAEYLGNGQEKVALGFDLSRPIKSQVEDARRLLLVLQRHRQNAGNPYPYTLDTVRERWTLYLRVLDAESAAELPLCCFLMIATGRRAWNEPLPRPML